MKSKITNKKLFVIERIKKLFGFNDSLSSALAVLILSPFSIVMGFKLNEYLASPKLSIEFVMLKEVKSVGNIIELENIFKNSVLYKNFRAKPFNTHGVELDNLSGYKDVVDERYIIEIRKEISEYTLYLNHEKKAIKAKLESLDKSTLGDLSVLALYYADNIDLLTPEDHLRDSVKTILVKETEKYEQELFELKTTMVDINEVVKGIRFKIAVLNKGATDGLIRNEATLSIGDSNYLINKVAPPKTLEAMNSVPTYNINEAGYESNAVGRIEKNSMAEYWFLLNNKNPAAIYNHIIQLTKYEITLRDQDNNEIKKTSTFDK